MKKILMAVATMLAVMPLAFAQSNIENARKAAEKARATTLDPKGAAKPASWFNFGKKMLDAYNAPLKEFSSVQYKIQLSDLGLKAKKTEVVQLEGKPVEKLTFENACLYFSTPGGQLLFAEALKKAYPDALEQSFEAYKKGYSIDPKKSKEASDAFKEISRRFNDEATLYYYTGKLDKAAYMFEQAAVVSAEAPLSQTDTTALFNASIASRMSGDNAKAKEILKRCLEFGYDGGGKVYSNLYYVTSSQLADAATAADTLAIRKEAKSYLEEGIGKYPLNQEIVVNLINQKIELDEDPESIFGLFDQAKKQDPKNASLYAVEADIRSKIGMKEQALEGYKQSVKVDPSYAYGWYCIGKFYYDQAMDYNEAAQREDDNKKYEELVNKYTESMEAGLEPFEKFFELSEKSNRDVAAQYLKIMYYNLYAVYSRMGKDDPGYKEKNAKYTAYLKGE